MNFSAPAISAQWVKHRRLADWGRMFAGYFCVQAAAQGFGFLAGILVVRSLPKEDYAWFMIVNTIAPVMNLLSDNGIVNSLSAIGGKFWEDDMRMGSLVNTAMILRRQLVLACMVVLTPVLVWMLWRNQAPAAAITWLIPITLAGVFLQLKTGVLGVVVGLRQQLGRMQALVFMGVLPRLAVIGLLAEAGWLNTPLAVAAGTVALAAQLWLLEQWVWPQISRGAPPDPELRKGILAIVKRQAPLTLYFCLQSQIGIWLISIFGSTGGVADLGALGRLGTIFGILMSTISAIVIPRFARCQDLARLRSWYAFILLGFTGLVLLSTLFEWWVPGPLLWLLGAQYAKLGSLVWLTALVAGVSNLAGLVYFLNINKGWIPPAYVSIPAEIAALAAACALFGVSTVRGMLLIGVFASIVPGLINLYYAIRMLRGSAPSARILSSGCAE